MKQDSKLSRLANRMILIVNWKQIVRCNSFSLNSGKSLFERREKKLRKFSRPPLTFLKQRTPCPSLRLGLKFAEEFENFIQKRLNSLSEDFSFERSDFSDFIIFNLGFSPACGFSASFCVWKVHVFRLIEYKKSWPFVETTNLQA